MKKRTINFDNFMQEQKKEPIYVTVYGREYAAKAEIPAIVMVNLARSDESSVTEAEAASLILQAGDIVFGKEAVNQMCEDGISASNLVLLIRQVFDMANGQDVDGDEGEDISDEAGMTAAGNKAKK
ncbi:MAG: hypothetical protein E7327_08855 [Clostridiales bacterium]|nr:hypothetical protein [Clostridiales bacterium]